MALFDKFKKSKEKKRIKGAGLLFCPEQVPQKALDQISEMFHIDINCTLCQGQIF